MAQKPANLSRGMAISDTSIKVCSPGVSMFSNVFVLECVEAGGFGTNAGAVDLGNGWKPLGTETKFQKAAATLALARAAANPRRPQSRGGSGAEVQTLRVLKLSAVFI